MTRVVTPAEFEAMRAKMREMALTVADTEEQVAGVFDHLAETRGDEDGHRHRIADDARKYAALERRRAAQEVADGPTDGDRPTLSP